MNQTTSEGLRAYFKRVSGSLTGLFNMAHAICGNYDLAEYALRSALLSVWQDNPQSWLGLQDKLRGKLRRIAVKVALSERGRRAELTWNGLRSPGADPILDLAYQESQEIRRCIVLKYGCDLSSARISRITGLPVSQLKTVFERFEARVRRRLPSSERRRFEGRIAQTIEDLLYTDAQEAPDSAALCRAFEAEAAQAPVSSHLLARVIGRLALVVLALLCALMFWLYAVISQPVRMETPAAPQDTIQSVPEADPDC